MAVSGFTIGILYWHILVDYSASTHDTKYTILYFGFHIRIYLYRVTRRDSYPHLTCLWYQYVTTIEELQLFRESTSTKSCRFRFVYKFLSKLCKLSKSNPKIKVPIKLFLVEVHVPDR
jgi:hypothetical protein